jgi:hypothetical protein
MAEDDWRAVIDTGLDGVFHLCRAAMFAMMKRRSGRIVAVTSVCGAYDHSGRGRDILARPGIAGFVKALAGQTARFGVSVNAVVPGLVAHDMADLVPERARGDLTETIAIRRFGDAAAVVDLVAILLSEKAAGITGTVLEARSVISLLTARGPGNWPARPPSPGRTSGPGSTGREGLDELLRAVQPLGAVSAARPHQPLHPAVATQEIQTDPEPQSAQQGVGAHHPAVPGNIRALAMGHRLLVVRTRRAR